MTSAGPARTTGRFFMPYDIFREGSRYCVYKVSEDGSRTGGSRGCHSTRGEATAQLRALYAAEEKMKADVGTFWVQKSEDGRLRWVAIYSNSYRDNDDPPEIIASDSHKSFAKRVWDGQTSPPDAWVWHVEDWKFGTGTWVSYDEVADGIIFPIAGGYVDPGMEPLALALDAMPNKALSHGMPSGSIRRDPSDKSIIVEHDTREVSVLPLWSAANKLTSNAFAVLKEGEQPVIANKKELLEREGVPAELLDQVEDANRAKAKEASAVGLAFKEADTPEVEETEQDTAPAEDVKEADSPAEEAVSTPKPEPQAKPAPELAAKVEVNVDYESIRKELTTFAEKLNAMFEVVGERLEALEKQVSGLQETEEARIKQRVTETPLASLTSLLNVESIIGTKEALVDGRTSLAKSGPKETKANLTGLFFDEWRN